MRASNSVLLLALAALVAACQTTPSGPLHAGGFLDADGGRIVLTTNRCFTYPPAAAAEGRQGTTRVRLAFDAQGQMTEPAIAQSSGHADIDQAALAFVRCAKPSADARELRRGAYSVDVPVTFFLKRG